MLAQIEAGLVEALTTGFASRLPVKPLPNLAPEALLDLFASQIPAAFVSPAPLTFEQGVLTVRWEVILLARLSPGQELARVQHYGLAWQLAAIGQAGIDTGPVTLYLESLDWLTGDAGKRLASKGALCASALLTGVADAPWPLDADDLARLPDLMGAAETEVRP